MGRKKGSGAEKAFNFIRDNIISYNYPPDYTISDYQISNELGIGRLSVREAIAKLKMYGLLEQNDTKVIVSKFSYDDIIELFQIRKAVECEAANLTISGNFITKQRFIEMDNIIILLQKSIESENLADNNKFDACFHDTLMSCCPNRRLVNIYNNLQLEALRARWVNVLESHSRRKSAHEEHIAILEAYKNSDIPSCQAAIRQHFTNSEEDAKRILNNPFYKISLQGLSNM